jgi:hypothetical protein
MNVIVSSQERKLFTIDFRNEEAYARCKLEVGMGNFKTPRRT